MHRRRNGGASGRIRPPRSCNGAPCFSDEHGGDGALCSAATQCGGATTAIPIRQRNSGPSVMSSATASATFRRGAAFWRSAIRFGCRCADDSAGAATLAGAAAAAVMSATLNLIEKRSRQRVRCSNYVQPVRSATLARMLCSRGCMHNQQQSKLAASCSQRVGRAGTEGCEEDERRYTLHSCWDPPTVASSGTASPPARPLHTHKLSEWCSQQAASKAATGYNSGP